MPKKHDAIEVHIPSVLGYEKVAMESAAALARIMGFNQSRIDDLKTAVSEACTNAMEHGNRLKRSTMVLVTLKTIRDGLEVNVRDEGSGIANTPTAPEITEQINGAQDAGGWGMFLIKNLVDKVEFKKIPNEGNVTRMVIYVSQEND